VNERTQIQTKTETPSFSPVPSLAARTNLLQRKCACGGTPGIDGECAECRKSRLQRRASKHENPETAPPIVHETLSSPGQPLDAGTRAFMERRFGHDFSRVRIHTDARAVESARAVNALAYTVGRDVVLGGERYTTSTLPGMRLLAHELTHVVQQERGESVPTSAFADASLEQSAEKSAQQITGAEPIAVHGKSAPAIARQPRSTSESVNPAALSDQELEDEINAIRQWLLQNRVRGAEREQLATTLGSLGSELLRRHPSVQPAGPSGEIPLLSLGLVSAARVAAAEAALGGAAAAAPKAAAGIGARLIGAGSAAAAGALAFVTVLFWPRTSIPGSDYERRQLEEWHRRNEPQPRVAEQPQPTTDVFPPIHPDTEQDRREDCRRMHPYALICDDYRDMEEVVVELIMRYGYGFEDLGACQGVGSFGEGAIDACDGAPGERWHCRVNRTSDVVSIFGCLCCQEDGTTSLVWRGEHWSDYMGRRLPRPTTLPRKR
jgi:hypothetical protein